MKTTWIISLMLIVSVSSMAQNERKLIREGYRAYMSEDYNEAEVNFRKAEDANPDSYAARYNTGTALYQKNKIKESAQRFSELLSEAEKPTEKAKIWHNIGNTLLESKQYQESIEAYKNSLRLNPEDEETRYNLAYAMEKLQEQQNKENQSQDRQKDNQEDKKKDQQQQNQEDNQKEQQDQQQDNKNDQPQDQSQNKQNGQQQNEDEKQQQPRPGESLTREEAQRLLQAILQKEKKVKEKVDKKRARKAKTKTDKDW